MDYFISEIQMKKYIVKRPGPSNSSIWEWKTYQKEGTTWVGPKEYDTEAEARAAGTEWDSNSVVVEINKPDV